MAWKTTRRRRAFPVVLTLSDARLNDADVCFAVDGAQLPATDGWTRAVLIFNGGDPEALDQAAANGAP